MSDTDPWADLARFDREWKASDLTHLVAEPGHCRLRLRSGATYTDTLANVVEARLFNGSHPKAFCRLVQALLAKGVLTADEVDSILPPLNDCELVSIGTDIVSKFRSH